MRSAEDQTVREGNSVSHIARLKIVTAPSSNDNPEDLILMGLVGTGGDTEELLQIFELLQQPLVYCLIVAYYNVEIWNCKLLRKIRQISFALYSPCTVSFQIFCRL